MTSNRNYKYSFLIIRMAYTYINVYVEQNTEVRETNCNGYGLQKNEIEIYDISYYVIYSIKKKSYSAIINDYLNDLTIVHITVVFLNVFA